MSNGSPWVNWSQFAAMNESETQRMADEARRAQEDRQRQYAQAMGRLEEEAAATGAAGHFGGDVTKLRSYGDLMKLQQEQAGRTQPGAMGGAPWESLLKGQQDASYSDPWKGLSERLQNIGRIGQTEQAGYTSRQKEHQDYLKRQAEKNKPRPLTPGEEYTRYSNAVQAAGRGGGTGGSVYFNPNVKIPT